MQQQGPQVPGFLLLRACKGLSVPAGRCMRRCCLQRWRAATRRPCFCPYCSRQCRQMSAPAARQPLPRGCCRCLWSRPPPLPAGACSSYQSCSRWAAHLPAFALQSLPPRQRCRAAEEELHMFRPLPSVFSIWSELLRVGCPPSCPSLWAPAYSVGASQCVFQVLWPCPVPVHPVSTVCRGLPVHLALWFRQPYSSGLLVPCSPAFAGRVKKEASSWCSCSLRHSWHTLGILLRAKSFFGAEL